MDLQATPTLTPRVSGSIRTLPTPPVFNQTPPKPSELDIGISYTPQEVPIAVLADLAPGRPRSNTPSAQLIKAQSCKIQEEPNSQALVSDLDVCDINKVSNTCKRLFAQKLSADKPEQYRFFHELELVASECVLTKPDRARIIFSALDAHIALEKGGMTTKLLQNNRIVDFTEKCGEMLSKAKTQQPEVCQKIIFEFREKIEELLLLGRPDYALAILNQLKNSKCVAEDDKEVSFYIQLIEGTVQRYLMVSWSADRTTHPFAQALVFLAEKGNFSHFVQHLEESAKNKYAPAIEALKNLKNRYPEGLPQKLDGQKCKSFASEIASKAGFHSGFNVDEMSVFKLKKESPGKVIDAYQA
jgi:hypothetical protein